MLFRSQLPNTKIKVLQRLLSQAIDEYKKVNRIMGIEFSDRLKPGMTPPAASPEPADVVAMLTTVAGSVRDVYKRQGERRVGRVDVLVAAVLLQLRRQLGAGVVRAVAVEHRRPVGPRSVGQQTADPVSKMCQPDSIFRFIFL